MPVCHCFYNSPRGGHQIITRNGDRMMTHHKPIMAVFLQPPGQRFGRRCQGCDQGCVELEQPRGSARALSGTLTCLGDPPLRDYDNVNPSISRRIYYYGCMRSLVAPPTGDDTHSYVHCVASMNTVANTQSQTFYYNQPPSQGPLLSSHLCSTSATRMGGRPDNTAEP